MREYGSIRDEQPDRNYARFSTEKLAVAEVVGKFTRVFDGHRIRFVQCRLGNEYVAIHDVRKACNYNITEASAKANVEVLVDGYGQLRFIRVYDLIHYHERLYPRANEAFLRFVKWAKRSFSGFYPQKPNVLKNFKGVDKGDIDPYVRFFDEVVNLMKEFRSGNVHKEVHIANFGNILKTTKNDLKEV